MLPPAKPIIDFVPAPITCSRPSERLCFPKNQLPLKPSKISIVLVFPLPPANTPHLPRCPRIVRCGTTSGYRHRMCARRDDIVMPSRVHLLSTVARPIFTHGERPGVLLPYVQRSPAGALLLNTDVCPARVNNCGRECQWHRPRSSACVPATKPFKQHCIAQHAHTHTNTRTLTHARTHTNTHTRAHLNRGRQPNLLAPCSCCRRRIRSSQRSLGMGCRVKQPRQKPE